MVFNDYWSTFIVQKCFFPPSCYSDVFLKNDQFPKNCIPWLFYQEYISMIQWNCRKSINSENPVKGTNRDTDLLIYCASAASVFGNYYYRGGKMREDDRGRSTGPACTAVLARLPQLSFSKWGKGGMACQYNAQQEEGIVGQGDNEAASLQPGLGYGSVYSSLTALGPHWKCAVQTTPDKCSVWLQAAKTNCDPIFHSLT